MNERYVLSHGPAGVARRLSPCREPSPSIRPLARGETAQKCLICTTTLRIPEGIRVFRCSECNTINELHSAVGTAVPLQKSEILAFESGSRGLRNRSPGIAKDSLLACRMQQTFASLQSLDRSFTANGSLDEPLEMEIVDRFYTLVKRDEAAQKAMIEGLKTLLQRPGNLDEQEPFWRWAVIIARCPLLLEKTAVISSDVRRDLLSRFFGIVSNLSSPQQHRLCRYWAKMASICLPLLVVAANSLLSHRLAVCKAMNERAYMQDWRLAVTVKVLSLCFVANKRAIEREQTEALPADAFYNVAIDALGAAFVVQDFEIFRRLPKLIKDGSPAPLVFCAYPFLLSMGLKQALLSYENRRSMASSARSALRSTLTGNMESPVLVLRVRRSHIVQDSLEQLFANRTQLKKPLRITFVGEEGIDAGGLQKEWLMLLSSELFRPQYGMFLSDEDSNLCWFNEWAPSAETEAEFFIVGVCVGLGVYSSSPIEISLPLAAYKMLIRGTPTFEDFKMLHPSLAHGLEMLLTFDGDVEETFCRTFVAEKDVYGRVEQVELVPGGRDIAVTAENRQEFVALLVQHTFSAAARQFSAFAKGFLQVCGGNALSLFSAQELELLVRGQEPSALDISQLQACAQLENWPANDVTVKLFWEHLASLKPVEQRKLLAFICGSGRLPATGTLKLRLTCNGRSSQLPTSHTCYNQLVMPRYKTLHDLSRALTTSVHESVGFGLR